ncbi:hypothetical protein UlMin_025240 [Ulmus minor]
MALQTNLILIISYTITMVLAAIVPMFGCSSSRLRYTVGNTPWTIPPYQDFYTNWSSSHFFKIGDSLVFKFDTGRYNVIQVSGQEYRRCTTFNPFRIINEGPAIIPLTEIGVFYFVCNISTYCNLGQKVDVTVHDCSEETPPPPPLPPLAVPPQSPPYYAGPVSSPILSPIGSGNSSPPPIISPVLPPSTEPVSSPDFSPIRSGNSLPPPPDRSGIIMASRGKFGVDCGGLVISSLVFGMSMVLGF